MEPISCLPSPGKVVNTSGTVQECDGLDSDDVRLGQNNININDININDIFHLMSSDNYHNS